MEILLRLLTMTDRTSDYALKKTNTNVSFNFLLGFQFQSKSSFA